MMVVMEIMYASAKLLRKNIPSYAHVVTPCSCGSLVLMRFSHAHAVILFEREGIARSAPGAADLRR
jgi:hypothetical protein